MKSRSFPFASLLLPAVLAGLVLLAPAPARAWDWPRLGLYGCVFGNGYPLWDSTGTLDPVALDQIARYQEVILDVGPITPYRPDALGQLRLRRPDIALLAYVLGQMIWDSNDPDSLVHIPTRINHMVRDMNGYLYNKAGGKFGGANINLAKQSGGRYVMAEAMADLFVNSILATGMWDGIFIDVYCNSVTWIQSPGDSIDYVRAGYPTLAAFDVGWRAGADTLASRLRRLGGKNVVLVGNCGQGTRYANFNGWMRENFPLQNGGTWYNNMYWDPGGYFTDEARFLPVTHNYIFTAVQGGVTPYSANNARKVRLGLGSAALGSGFGVFGASNRQVKPYPYHQWWYDEYAVNLATGSASTDLRDTGWLGQPLGDYYQMVWDNTGPDAVSNAGFETDVTTGWTFGGPSATMVRDTTSAPVGWSSAHITVPFTTPWTYSISLTSTGTIPLNAGLQYSATFWARAATPRTIWIAAAHTGPGDFTGASLAIGTTWKRYQVTLVPPTSGDSRLQFQVGGPAGDVWLDDCHFQAGTSSFFRRDFQNGIVLVNPGGYALTAPLERDYKKIAGLVDPTVNDGTTVTQVTVGAMDALFLIGSDRTPPSAVNDLREIP